MVAPTLTARWPATGARFIPPSLSQSSLPARRELGATTEWTFPQRMPPKTVRNINPAHEDFQLVSCSEESSQNYNHLHPS
jgi:hypothetical protein